MCQSDGAGQTHRRASSVQSEHLSFAHREHKLHQTETFASVVAEVEAAGLPKHGPRIHVKH